MKAADHTRILSSFFVFIALVLGPVSGPFLSPQAVVRAQSDPTGEAFARIEQQIEKRRQELGVPGIGLALIKDGRVHLKGLGLKDVERGLPVTPDTQFPIGSATKAFTALSVLMTQDDGKLSLDDSPKKYLPFFKLRDPQADDGIQVRDLLTHSSGLNRTDLAWITGKLKREELIRVLGEAKPTAKLRESFQYQNLMYAAAGETVARSQKTPWEAFVPQRIFTPLGMTDSTMSASDLKKVGDRALGYEYNSETKTTRMLPYRSIDEVAPAGSINSSVRDMVKWVQFIIDGGVAGGRRLVSKESFEEWTKPHQRIAGKNFYSLGWFVMDWNGHKVLQHGGNIDGFTSLVGMIPEKKLGFVILTNANGTALPPEMMPLIFKEILGNPAAPANPTTADAAKEAGTYRLEAAKMDITIRFEDGKLSMTVPGQPTYELINVGPRRYRLGGAPDGFFVTFKDDSMLLEQPQGDFTLPRLKSDAEESSTPPPPPARLIEIEELMSKAVEAVGGEANWRRLTSRKMTTEIDFEHQGVKGRGTVLAKAPYFYAATTTLTALGKEIGSTFEFLNGTSGGQRTSFSPGDDYVGSRLNDLRAENGFYGLVDWKNGLKSYAVKGREKVGGEDAWLVEFIPQSGTAYRLHISVESGLVLKRSGTIVSSTSSVTMPVTVLYQDYREVDGVKLPFKVTTSTPGIGDVVTRVTSVRHNVTLRDGAFRPGK
jgi:CubicO group peptidase (beta-lactamase class C family)